MIRKQVNRLVIAITSAMIAVTAFASSANASLFVVDAFSNSSTGGSGVATVGLTTGELFTVSVDPTDLWNAGALPRWSNADGLTGNLFATGSDDSGELAATLIGINFGLFTDHGLSAPYGTLVGEIGGIYQVLGTSFNGAAWNTGTLHLFYWDSNFSDNTEHIAADVEVVPEPGTLVIIAFGLLSLLGLGVMRRRARI
jgi:hypothetical protein